MLYNSHMRLPGKQKQSVNKFKFKISLFQRNQSNEEIWLKETFKWNGNIFERKSEIKKNKNNRMINIDGQYWLVKH